VAMAGLSDFMDANTSTGLWYSPDTLFVIRGVPSGLRLADSGPASRRIASAARRPELAEQVLASLFWWCYVRTRKFRSDSRGVSGSQVQRQIIVSHADGTRHDLLLLAPDVGEPFEATASDPYDNRRHSPQRGDGAISGVALGEGERMREMLVRAGIEVDARTAILAVSELAEGANFRLVVAREPGETPTEARITAEAAVLPFAAPAPALAVTVSNDPRPIATAGVIGTDETGRLLAITALHAVAAMPEIAARIRVGGAPASIVGRHELTDSCLLSVACQAGTSAGRAGLLRFAPQAYRVATFDGAASGHKQTKIFASDLSVLDPSPYLSSKVYTDPDTIPGDSGSALVDFEDHIVGFAVSRTALGAPVEFSAWSWAGQVLAAHGLA
jgi:hypothetical protein